MTAPGSAQRSNGLGLGILAGAFTGALVIALVWLLVVPRSDTAVPGPSPSPAMTSPAPSDSTTPSASTTPTAPVTPSGEPTPDLSVPPGEDDDVITELPSGSWVTVLKSLPQAGTSREQALELAKGYGNADHPARVLDTNAFPMLTPNYWAIVIPGSASRDESNLVCAALGLAVANNCYARQV